MKTSNKGVVENERCSGPSKSGLRTAPQNPYGFRGPVRPPTAVEPAQPVFSTTPNNGFSVLMAIIALLLLGGAAATTLTIVSTSQEERATGTASEQAYALAQAGIEYAKNRIDQGLNPVVSNYPFGPGTFTIAADPAAGALVVTGQVGTAKRTHTLSTQFGAQCVNLDVTQAHSASRNLVGMKLSKRCLAKSIITDWTFTWDPAGYLNPGTSVSQEKTVKLQVTGEQLATLYDYPAGYESGRKIDATDFVMTRSTGYYPVNKVEFNNNIIPGKRYTVNVHLGDGSTVTKSFVDPGPSLSEISPGGGGGGTVGGGQGFEVRTGGDVVVSPQRNVTVKALCSEITYGAGGPKIPVKAWLGVNKVYSSLYSGATIKGGETFIGSAGASGATYTVKANARYGSFNATYDSNNVAQVKTLLNESTPPPLQGYGGQKPVSQCVSPYLNSATGKARLNANQVILLFELGVNMATNPSSPAADFQDLVVLLTID